MTWHDTELFPFPPYELTEVIDQPDRHCIRDGVVARLTGVRPLHIDVDIPRSETPVPVVAWIHGGAWQWGSNKLNDGPVPSRQIREQLVAAGIAFAAIDYRLSGEAPWPAALHDVKAGIRWLRHYAGELNLDPTRVAVWGESAGGHLAALVATTGNVPALAGELGPAGYPTGVSGCVNWYGPGDLGALLAGDAREPVTRFLGNDLARAASASPLSHVDATSAPMLLIHGAQDTAIPSAQSTALADAYRRVGAGVDVRIIPGAGHAFAHSDPEAYIEPSIRFLTTCFESDSALTTAAQPHHTSHRENEYL